MFKNHAISISWLATITATTEHWILDDALSPATSGAPRNWIVVQELTPQVCAVYKPVISKKCLYIPKIGLALNKLLRDNLQALGISCLIRVSLFTWNFGSY